MSYTTSHCQVGKHDGCAGFHAGGGFLGEAGFDVCWCQCHAEERQDLSPEAVLEAAHMDPADRPCHERPRVLIGV